MADKKKSAPSKKTAASSKKKTAAKSKASSKSKSAKPTAKKSVAKKTPARKKSTTTTTIPDIDVVIKELVPEEIIQTVSGVAPIIMNNEQVKKTIGKKLFGWLSKSK